MEPKIAEKAWDPKLENAILKKWEEEKLYDFQLSDNNYTIDTPPPYPSGRPWHIGAASHYAQIDMIARTARMSGKNVYFPIGIDRNGLPVELYTEKKHGIRMRETERGEFLELCKNALDDLEAEMIQIMKSLGLSGDFKNYYRTDSEDYRKFTQETFIDLWKKGVIYLATRPNNYDWVSGTTIADAEIVYEEIPTKLVYMKFITKETKKEIIIASTRPELLCACKTVIVNPNDERYSDLIGKELIVPLTNSEVKITPHHSAKIEFGSGAVMVCSYGDQNDVALFRELQLEEVIAIGLDGRMTEAAGDYQGLKPKQARTKIIEDLENANLVEKIEEISHSSDYVSVPSPDFDSRPEASPNSLKKGKLLGTFQQLMTEEDQYKYLLDIRENQTIYKDEKIVHPGWLLRMANKALSTNVKLGPWIHVGSKIQNFNVAHYGETLSTQTSISNSYENKGHLFVEMDVTILKGVKYLTQISHTAIYRPRQAIPTQ